MWHLLQSVIRNRCRRSRDGSRDYNRTRMRAMPRVYVKDVDPSGNAAVTCLRTFERVRAVCLRHELGSAEMRLPTVPKQPAELLALSQPPADAPQVGTSASSGRKCA